MSATPPRGPTPRRGSSTYPRRPASGVASTPQWLRRAAEEPVRQRLLLLDGATRFLSMAALAIEADDGASKTRHIGRALRILATLGGGSRDAQTPEVTRSHDRLFREVALGAADASLRFDAPAVREAADLLRPLRRAWADVAARQTITDTRAGDPPNNDR